MVVKDQGWAPLQTSAGGGGPVGRLGRPGSLSQLGALGGPRFLAVPPIRTLEAIWLENMMLGTRDGKNTLKIYWLSFRSIGVPPPPRVGGGVAEGPKNVTKTQLCDIFARVRLYDRMQPAEGVPAVVLVPLPVEQHPKCLLGPAQVLARTPSLCPLESSVTDEENYTFRV